MKIYKISQKETDYYDTYDSAIVVANNEEEAKRIHPGSEDYEFEIYYNEEKKEFWNRVGNGNTYKFEDDSFGTWVNNLAYINVEYIGEADKKYKKPQVIVASFNAG